MAWNDPGKNRNPWGNRPDKGAADLDEALRNLQRKLSQMFGGKGGGGDDGGRDGGGGGGDSAVAALPCAVSASARSRWCSSVSGR